VLKLRDEQWERIREQVDRHGLSFSGSEPSRSYPRCVDRAYGSDKFDEQLHREGIKIPPDEGNKIQDGRRLRRYQRRWNFEPSLPDYNGTLCQMTPCGFPTTFHTRPNHQGRA